VAGAGSVSAARRLPADAVLPQLAQLLDEAAMRAVFSRELHWQGAGTVQACAIERVKYRPGRSCVVGYRLTLGGTLEAQREQRLCASVYPPEEARARYRSGLQDAPSTCMDLGAYRNVPPVSFVAPMSMVVRAFPCDRKLPALHVLTDPGVVAGCFLPALVAARWGQAARVAQAQQRVISYFPEHTCTVRADVRVQDGDVSRDWRVFGKIRYDDAGATTHALMQQLWDSAVRQNGSTGLARPLHYDPTLRMLWQEAAPGVPLASLLDSGDATPAVLARTAGALAGLHGSGVIPARAMTMHDVLDGLPSAARVVAAAAPDCAGALRTLTQTLMRAVPDEGTSGTLHGDLHSNNILVARDQTSLIDIDRLAHGPVLIELGSLLAELVLRDCLRAQPVDLDRLRGIAQAYAAEQGRTLDARALAWHCASALVRERALRCVTSLKPGRMEALPALLDAAHTLLCDPAAFGAAPAAKSSAADPAEASLLPLTDVPSMSRILEPVVARCFDGAGIEALEIEYAWRKLYAKAASWPKSTLKLCYRLRLRHRVTGAVATAFLHGEAELQQVRAQPCMEDAQHMRLRIGSASLALQCFPDDAGLPQLRALLSGPACTVLPTALRATAPQIVRYRPGVRCTLRYVGAGAPAVFGKTFADDTGAHAFRRASYLWSMQQRPGARVIVPEPIAYDPATRTLWTAEAQGVLAAAARDDASLASAIEAVMRCLAGLHQSGLPLAHAVSRAQLLGETRKRAVKLGRCLPAWSRPLQRLVHACERVVDALPAPVAAPLHGDAHLEQFLVGDAGAAMLDFDEMRAGEAAQDLAGILVDLALRAPGRDGLRVRACAAYARAAGAAPGARLLAWHECLQFINKAYRLLCRATPAQGPAIELALGRALECARRLESLEEHSW